MWTNVIAIFIVVAAASTIGVASGTITSAADAAQALEPVAGRLAEALFAVGLFGASVLAATIMPLSTAFVICEAFGWESGVDKRFADARAFFSIYTFVLVAGALVVLLPGLDLLPLIIASQNLQGLLLPVVLVFMVLLVNDRRLMGEHRNGRIGERARLVGGRAGRRPRRRAARGRRARAVRRPRRLSLRAGPRARQARLVRVPLAGRHRSAGTGRRRRRRTSTG